MTTSKHGRRFGSRSAVARWRRVLLFCGVAAAALSVGAGTVIALEGQADTPEGQADTPPARAAPARAAPARAAPARVMVGTTLGGSELDGVACPAKGECVAVGTRASGSTAIGVVLPAPARGRRGRPIAVAGTASLDGVACPRERFCIAVGQSAPTSALDQRQGVVVPISLGKPAPPRTVPGVADIVGVSCGSPRSCWATARLADGTGSAMIEISQTGRAEVHVMHGITLGAASGGATAPACTSASVCTVLGSPAAGGAPFVATVNDGTVKTVSRLPDVVTATGLACLDQQTCLAAGNAAGRTTVIVPIAHGKPAAPRRIRAPMSIAALTCVPLISACYAVGPADADGHHGYILPIEQDRPDHPLPVGLGPVAIGCAGESCTAAAAGGARAIYHFSEPLRAPPRIVQDPIPFSAQRKNEMRLYSLHNYGINSWRLIDPRLVIWHFTDSSTFQSVWNTFADDVPDGEYHLLPQDCAHFVVDTNGTIYQLVPLNIMCRQVVGLNYTALGIENVGFTDQQVMGDAAQYRSTLALTRWLRCRFHIPVPNVIGHNESLSSPYYRELIAALRGQTHNDFNRADMNVVRAAVAKLPCLR